MPFQSDIIEVRLLDESFTPFYKGTARLKKKKDMDNLNEVLEKKESIKIINVKKSEEGWFD